MEQNIEISCNVCQDLMPLVLDEIASEDSGRLVHSHIESCKECESLYLGLTKPDSSRINDQNNIKTIINKLYLFGLFALIAGALFGVYLTNTTNIFYNIILMPFVGAFGYLILRKKGFLVPIGIFVITYLWLLIIYVIENGSITAEILTYPIFFVLIYTLLAVIGLILGFLLKYVFQKERMDNE